MPEDDFAALVERVRALTGLGIKDAFKVAESIEDEPTLTSVQIIDAAASCGFDMSEARVQVQDDAPAMLPQVTFDPVEVLAAVYRECPRCLPVQEGAEAVFIPKIGKAPKGSEFHTPEIEELVANLPEQMRLLVGGVDMHNGTLTITLYDEANDVDRTIGPIDLTSMESQEAFNAAVEALLSRVARVIAADFN